MNIYLLDGSRMTSREEAHAFLKRSLRLPDYYGANLDALADCLGAFGPEDVVILTRACLMREALGEYALRLETVFSDSAKAFSFRWAVCEE